MRQKRLAFLDKLQNTTDSPEDKGIGGKTTATESKHPAGSGNPVEKTQKPQTNGLDSTEGE